MSQEKHRQRLRDRQGDLPLNPTFTPAVTRRTFVTDGGGPAPSTPTTEAVQAQVVPVHPPKTRAKPKAAAAATPITEPEDDGFDLGELTRQPPPADPAQS